MAPTRGARRRGHYVLCTSRVHYDTLSIHIPSTFFFNSQFECQKGVATSHYQIQLDPFAS